MTTVSDLRTSPTNLPRILARNLFREGTITASSGTGRYAVDWRVDRRWEPGVTGASTLEVLLDASTAADCMAVLMHNLDEAGATVKAQYFNGSWQDCHAAVTPTDNGPIFVSFNSVSSTRFRIVIDAADANPVAAVVAIGPGIFFEDGIQPGWTPPGYASQDEIIDSLSEDGILVGRQLLKRPERTQLDLAHVDDAWMRTYWKPNRERLIRYPWILAWSPLTDDEGAALVWTDGVPPPDAYEMHGFQKISWPLLMLSAYDVADGETVQEVASLSPGQGLISIGTISDLVSSVVYGSYSLHDITP
jgi:hypothetical protein